MLGQGEYGACYTHPRDLSFPYIPPDAARNMLMELTVNEVAERLTVSPLTVRRWLNAGSLSGIQPGDRAACRITEMALATFLDARRRGGVQERPQRATTQDI